MSSILRSVLPATLYSYCASLAPTVSRYCPWMHYSSTGSLHQLNKLYLDSYRIRKEETKKALGWSKPVILIKEDDLILHYQGQRSVLRYIPEQYHLLKDIAHISCLIHTLSRIKNAEEIRKKALSHLEEAQSSLTPSLAKYRPLLEKYKKLLEGHGELTGLKNELESLIFDAARCRLTALHQQVQKIKREMDPDLWKNMAVVVMGPAMPRKGELSMQYMHAALQSSTQRECPYRKASTNESSVLDGQRLIYAESIQEESQALDLLTTHICDESLGESLLEDKEAMHGDFLRTATQQHMRQLDFEE
jgi:hypothetical protein